MDSAKVNMICGAVAGGVFLLGSVMAFFGLLSVADEQPISDPSNLQDSGVNILSGDAGEDYDPVERGLFAGLLRENVSPISVSGGVQFDLGDQRISYPMTYISISTDVYPENYIICLPDSEGMITPYALMRLDGQVPFVSAAGQDLVMKSGICDQFQQ